MKFFYILLTINQERNQISAYVRWFGLSTSRKIVSIVDDELDITQLFHDALSNNIDDASIMTFNDPIIALEHYTKNKQRYAMVIADMRMPAVSGLELLKKVKKLNPQVRTILIVNLVSRSL